MRMIDDAINGLIFLLMLGSMIWVLLDVNKLMPGLSRAQRRSVSSSGPQTPKGWVTGCVLFWIVFFPWYLMVRSGYKRARAQNQAARAGGFPVVMPDDK